MCFRDEGKPWNKERGDRTYGELPSPSQGEEFEVTERVDSMANRCLKSSICRQCEKSVRIVENEALYCRR